MLARIRSVRTSGRSLMHAPEILGLRSDGNASRLNNRASACNEGLLVALILALLTRQLLVAIA